jgi:hypothetical protein
MAGRYCSRSGWRSTTFGDLGSTPRRRRPWSGRGRREPAGELGLESELLEEKACGLGVGLDVVGAGPPRLDRGLESLRVVLHTACSAAVAGSVSISSCVIGITGCHLEAGRFRFA